MKKQPGMEKCRYCCSRDHCVGACIRERRTHTLHLCEKHVVTSVVKRRMHASQGRGGKKTMKCLVKCNYSDCIRRCARVDLKNWEPHIIHQCSKHLRKKEKHRALQGRGLLCRHICDIERCIQCCVLKSGTEHIHLCKKHRRTHSEAARQMMRMKQILDEQSAQDILRALLVVHSVLEGLRKQIDDIASRLSGSPAWLICERGQMSTAKRILRAESSRRKQQR